MGARKRLRAEKLKADKKTIAIAQLKKSPISPRKMRLAADLIRGVEVNKALNILQFSNKDAAKSLEKLLSSTEYPNIKIKSKSIEGQFPDYEVHSVVNIKDRDFNLIFPAKVSYDKKSFVSKGEINLRHDMLGLTPFSAAGGLLTVRDLMVVSYKISGLIQPN